MKVKNRSHYFIFLPRAATWSGSLVCLGTWWAATESHLTGRNQFTFCHRLLFVNNVLGFKEIVLDNPILANPLIFPFRWMEQTFSGKIFGFAAKSFFGNIKTLWTCLFSCPEYLNRWPCHWLSHWLSDFWFWHYRVTLETCDIWDIWSEWWEDMTWPKNIYLPSYLPTYLLPMYLH